MRRRRSTTEGGSRDERRLLRDLEPRPRDLVAKDGQYVDLGWPRRRDAARDLVLAGGDAVTRALLRRLDDLSPEVRLTALSSLITRVHENELEIVAAVLRWPEDDARAEGAELLLERVDGDDGAAVRILDAYALAESDAPGAVFDPDWVEAVYNVVGAETRHVLLEGAVDRCVRAEEPPPRAVQALRTDRTLAVQAFLERLERRSTDVPRTIGLLGALRSTEASEPLATALRDGDPRVRAAAAQALGDIQDPRAAPDLLALSADTVYEVRDAAQRALDALGSAGVMWSIAAAARNEPGAGEDQLSNGQPVRQISTDGQPPVAEPEPVLESEPVEAPATATAPSEPVAPSRPAPPVSGLVPRLRRRLESGR